MRLRVRSRPQELGVVITGQTSFRGGADLALCSPHQEGGLTQKPAKLYYS